MALTNYLLQSFIGAMIFTGYGLGLYGRVGTAAGLALSVAIFAAQIPLSEWWFSRFRFGPAEWLLRSFTYGRIQPLRPRKASCGWDNTPSEGPGAAGARPERTEDR